MKAQIVGRAGHQAEWGGAFAEGLRRHGWAVDMMPEPGGSCDLLVLWGTRKQDAIHQQIRDGGQVCILERGYLGDRFAWSSVSFGGGLNGRAEFRGVRSDPARFDRHFGHLMRPWRAKEGYALLIGQVPGDMSLAGVGGSLDGWYADVTAVLAAKGYDVRFRPHPVAVQRGKRFAMPVGAKPVGGALDVVVAGAAIVVTFNSNTAVESVLAGVPTVAIDRGSMAWPVTTHFLETEPQMPDRETWAAELAWKQWTLDEMASGECWDHVGQIYAAI